MTDRDMADLQSEFGELINISSLKHVLMSSNSPIVSKFKDTLNGFIMLLSLNKVPPLILSFTAFFCQTTSLRQKSII